MQIDVGNRQFPFPKHKAVTLPRELRVFAITVGKMGKDLLLTWGNWPGYPRHRRGGYIEGACSFFPVQGHACNFMVPKKLHQILACKPFLSYESLSSFGWNSYVLRSGQKLSLFLEYDSNSKSARAGWLWRKGSEMQRPWQFDWLEKMLVEGLWACEYDWPSKKLVTLEKPRCGVWIPGLPEVPVPLPAFAV